MTSNDADGPRQGGPDMRLRPVNLGGLTLWSIDPDPVGECWPLGLSQTVALDVVETAITSDSGWQLSTIHSC